jgi:hypothetical protein
VKTANFKAVKAARQEARRQLSTVYGQFVGCPYLSESGSVCNKCGRIHDTEPPTWDALLSSCAAKTNAERQADLKARRIATGMRQVTNLWAHPDDHAAIKAYAAKLQRKRQKAR